MSDVKVGSPVLAVISRLQEAIADGDLSSGEQAAIVEAAQQQSGGTDPAVLAQMSTLAEQMQALAQKLATPQVRGVARAAFPAKLDPELTTKVEEAVWGGVPLSFSDTASVVGARPSDGGGYQVLVAAHTIYEAPEDAKAHYLVSVSADGVVGDPQPVKLIA